MLRYDNINIPDNKEVVKAELVVYVDTMWFGPGKMVLHPLKRSFTGSATWMWYTTGYSWDKKGGDYFVSKRLDSLFLELDSVDSEFMRFNIPLDYMLNIQNGTKENNGFLLNAEVEDGANAYDRMDVIIHSSESAEKGKRPKLEITIDDPTNIKDYQFKYNNMRNIISVKWNKIFINKTYSNRINVSLYNIKGIKVNQWNIGSTATENGLNLPQTKGVYWLRIEEDNVSYVQKIWKY